MAKMPEPEQDTYPDEEAQRRFEAITRAVLSMPPEPRKAVARKGRESNRNAGERTTRQPRQR